jgi:hypothetical protein
MMSQYTSLRKKKQMTPQTHDDDSFDAAAFQHF